MKPNFPDVFLKLPEHEGQFPAHVLEANNCTVYFSTLAKGTVIPPHDHDTDNHSVITEGELILEIDGKEKRYPKGEWCFVPAKAKHSARTESDTSLIEFWFKS